MHHREIMAMMAEIAPVIRDYTAAAMAPLLKRIDELEARQPERGERGEQGPIGERGEKGDCGPQGGAGRDGKDAEPPTAAQIAEAVLSQPDAIAKAVETYLTANPPKGKDGEPGRDGRDGLPGVSGPVGEKGIDGKDGRDGVDGKDGRDGLGFDELTVEHDGERGVVLRFQRGEETKEFPISLPLVLDRGVYKDGVYERGDGVTWAGSFWIAQGATKGKPGEPGSEGWRLAVKRGRDGKDGIVKHQPAPRPVKVA